MSVLSVQSPFPIFTDTDGDPLESGYIWIGVANLDPQVNPLAVFWDAALSMPAVQPIRTLAGYPSQAGSPGRLYTNADHSIRVQNKRGTIVFTAGNLRDQFDADLIRYVGTDGLNYTVQDLSSSNNALKGAALVGYRNPSLGATSRNLYDKSQDFLTTFDFMSNAEIADIRAGTALIDPGNALQIALDAAEGGSIIFNPGRYLITRVLLINRATTIIWEGCEFINAIPNSVDWTDATTGQYAKACCFSNKLGFAQYVSRVNAGTVAASFDPSIALEIGIRFIGHANFIQTTLDETAKTGAWGAIGLFYIRDWYIQSFSTEVLNGLFVVEAQHGSCGSIQGRNIRAESAVGGVVQIGWLCENINFGNITGWHNFYTFIADGGLIRGITANIIAGDADRSTHPDWPPVSLRHVELTGVISSDFNIVCSGGGLFQQFIINSTCDDNKITCNLRNAYETPAQIQCGNRNSIKLLIDGGYMNAASAGHKIAASGEYGSGTAIYPAILVFHNGNGTIRDNELDIQYSRGVAASKTNYLVAESADAVALVANLASIERNTYHYIVRDSTNQVSPLPFCFQLKGASHRIRQHNMIQTSHIRAIPATAAGTAATNAGVTIYGMPAAAAPASGCSIAAALVVAEDDGVAGPTAGVLTVTLEGYISAVWTVLVTVVIDSSSATKKVSASTINLDHSKVVQGTSFWRIRYNTDGAWTATTKKYNAIAYINTFADYL